MIVVVSACDSGGDAIEILCVAALIMYQFHSTATTPTTTITTTTTSSTTTYY